ncbi:MAG: thiamine diphosphokinase [Clostridiales bacterium]|nr:thiamine diphosphokinase [Clostridiales bacterium]
MDLMKPCIIAGASVILDYDAVRPYFDEGGFVICADGGWRHTNALGITPDLIVGDFDSAPRPDLPGVEVIPHRPEKDDTDMMLAVQEAIARGYHRLYLLGGTGGRLDHTFANIQTLLYAAHHGADARLIDEGNEVLVLINGSITLPRRQDTKLSVFALSERAEGVNESGVQYPLENAVLTFGHPLGVSNEWKAENAQISVKNGTLLIILSKN